MVLRWRVRLLFGVIALAAYLVIVDRTGVKAPRPIPNPASNSTITQRTWDICIAGSPSAGIPVDEYPPSFNAATVVNSLACEKAMLAEINRRHVAEGVPAMVLPANFNSLSAAMQLVVALNAERVSRKLVPISGMAASLNADSKAAAHRGIDPNPSKADGNWSEYNSIWAGGYQSALMADFDWMYNDGWGGSAAQTINVDCKSTKDKSCWGHRDAILANYSLQAGDVLVAGGAVVTSGPRSLSLPSWAAAFESVPSNEISALVPLAR